jgi:hypothetical protein
VDTLSTPYETPEGREYRELQEDIATAEAAGLIEEKHLARKLRAGEVTFEEALQLFKDGKVFRPPKPYADPQTINEIDANTYGDDFANLKLAHTGPILTQDQYEQIKLARSGYVDDGDSRNTPRTTYVDGPAPG